MIQYIYEKQIIPNLDEIHNKVTNSEMESNLINYCRWDEKSKILRIYFTNELSENDKNILDSIVQTV